MIGKIGIPNLGKIQEKIFFETRTLFFETPYRKLEVDGSLWGKRFLKIKENGWGKGLRPFPNPIF